MMPVTIEFDEAIALLKRAVEEKGADYQYLAPPASPEKGTNGTCVYFYDGKPSCIVGHVLAYKGMTAEEIGDNNAGSGVYSLSQLGIIEVDEVTREFLVQVQQEQDLGVTWGDSLRAGIEYVKCLGAEVSND